jgi:periplasmic copper chaperone A
LVVATEYGSVVQLTRSHSNMKSPRPVRLVAGVVTTAHTPIEEGFRDTFELSINVPDDAAGQTIYFPTIQTCESGETAWIEIPAEHRDPEELESLAPGVAVVAAAEGDTAHDH